MHEIKFMARLIQIPLWIFFIVFFVVPLGGLLYKSVVIDGDFTLSLYWDALRDETIVRAFFQSMNVSLVAASITTIIAFILSYGIHFSNMAQRWKKIIKIMVVLPMLLPTITYGFVLIYTFGNQGTLTQLLGKPLFSVYGYNGLLIGYILYTLPIAFILIDNSMAYLNKRYMYVSYLMHDGFIRRFYHTVFVPMIGTIGGAFILAFVLSFTDFGIPASIGGEYEVIATTLYRTMLGSIVQFDQGAVIAMFMLIPAVFGVLLMQYVKKFQVEPTEVEQVAILEHKLRDWLFIVFSAIVVFLIVGIFQTTFIVPFTKGYPYDLTFTLEHLLRVLQDREFMEIYWQSIVVALLSAVVGTIVTFLAALLNVRTPLKGKQGFDWLSMMTNTVPGMVLGISYLFLFNNSSLKGTLIIIIASIIVHFFTTPYLMAKNALHKMDASWEVTGALLQDSWLQTVRRIILPNMRFTLFGMANYYFINAMVTVSGVIFIVSTDTALLSTWIKELQHFAKFNDIFILSIVIFITNVIVKGSSEWIMLKRKG